MDNFTPVDTMTGTNWLRSVIQPDLSNSVHLPCGPTPKIRRDPKRQRLGVNDVEQLFALCRRTTVTTTGTFRPGVAPLM